MHIIIKSQIDSLADSFELENLDDPKKFEIFTNYCCISKHYLGRFNPIDITTEEDDASIDGVAIIIDGELIITEDDALSILNTHKTNLIAEIIITQSKSGESFTKEEIANFKLGIDDYLSLSPKLPNGKLNIEALKIIKALLANSHKLRNKRPNINIYYCTTGVYKKEREIKAAFEIIEKSVKATDFFKDVKVTPYGRSEIIKIFTEITEKNEAKLKLIEFFGMPDMPGIPQSYVAIVSAKDYIDCLLTDASGNLKQSVFEENVRSYLGNNNEVNESIEKTLKDKNQKKLFSVLNNGITIVAPEISLIPNTKEIRLTNYQIINGCQTSSTLYENKNEIDDQVNVVIKFIESIDNDSLSNIISATNSQSDIKKEAFLGLKNKAKLVQKYFSIQLQKSPPENKIYFERRQSEFNSLGLQNSRIFDIREISRCYAAMFLDSPHNSARYVSRIFSSNELTSTTNNKSKEDSKAENKESMLFRETDHESYYYASALTLYKYQSLINGKKIGASNYTKVRWHIINLFKLFCNESADFPPANSNKADKYAQKIIDIINSSNKDYIDIFKKCQNIVDLVGMPSDDAIKRTKFSKNLIDAAKKQIAIDKLSKKSSPTKRK